MPVGFILELCKVIKTFESVDENLMNDQSNESCTKQVSMVLFKKKNGIWPGFSYILRLGIVDMKGF